MESESFLDDEVLNDFEARMDVDFYAPAEDESRQEVEKVQKKESGRSLLRIDSKRPGRADGSYGRASDRGRFLQADGAAEEAAMAILPTRPLCFSA